MRKKGKGQALIVALIAAAAAIVLYSLIFKLFRWQHYLIAAAVALLVGRVAFIMAQGLDTTKEAPAQQPIPKTGDSAVDSLVEKGQEMLAQIRRENDLIPDARLSERMAQLDDVADRIFRTVAEKPQKAPQIRRFMDYYLPTTLKMLAGYRKMDERQLSGGEAEKTRAQIQEAMDMVVGAFEKQLNTLYQDDMMDISTDIDVLETLLRQDGLVGSGLREDKREEK
ncbi:MAG: 5-bromo-4-chloroindolyl phosphate hydrolysis family protein [Clostridiales bacterium]|nr:5-bromo-4-chloroindolyl phosphate hydrolysis family protein [Clostridiales bacterium]